MLRVSSKKEMLEAYMPIVNNILRHHVDDDTAYDIAVELSQFFGREYDEIAKCVQEVVDISNNNIKNRYEEND